MIYKINNMLYTYKNPEVILTLDETIQFAKFYFITDKNKINNYLTQLIDKVIKLKNLENLIDNIYYHTSSFDLNVGFKDRLKLILLGINSYPLCKCGNEIKKIAVCSGKVIGFNMYCSMSCSTSYTNLKRPDGFYAEKVCPNTVKTRKQNNSYIPSDAFKYSSLNPEILKQKKLTCIRKYGVDNPGVLAAYHSKSGIKYIESYLKENNISQDQCYYAKGGITNKEYYQMVFSNELQKYLYFSYDLVVFDKSLENIILVLEYNGPWHYHKQEVLEYGDNPSVPYKTNKLTIKESYNRDLLKLNHIAKKCNNILIFWEKDNKLTKFNKDEY